MRHSRKLGAAHQRSFTVLLGGLPANETFLLGMERPLIRRRSSRSDRYAWYARSVFDGKTVERFVYDDVDLSSEQVLAMRAITRRVRRRETAVRRLAKARFPVPPARIVAMLDALGPALGKLVLVDDWALMLYEGLAGHRGCAFEEPLVYPPLSFVLGAGQGVDDLVDQMELSGGDWLATPQDLRGVTRITGPLGKIDLYDREIGAPAARIAAIARTGVMLTGQGLNVNVLSPLDQVFWDAWRASMNGADAAMRRARSARLASWAAEVEACRQPVLQWWMDFAPGITRAAIRSFPEPTQILLALSMLPGPPADTPEYAKSAEIPADLAEPSPGPMRRERIEWRPREHNAFAAFKLEIEAARDRLNISRAQFQTALAKAMANKPADLAQIEFVERELIELELEERRCTRRLSMKISELDAMALAAMNKANIRSTRAPRP